MKTTIMKKGIVLSMIALVVLVSTAFVANSNHKVNASVGDDAEYIYIIVYPNNLNNSEKTYVSGIITYQGYNVCESLSHDLFGDAGYKFGEYLERYNDINMDNWKMQYEGNRGGVSYPSGYFKGFSSRDEAKKARQKYINERENNSNRVLEINFQYECN